MQENLLLVTKLKINRLIVVEDFSLDTHKTKDFNKMLESLKIGGKKVLLLTSNFNDVIYKSGRNLPKVKVLEANKVSTYDILNNQMLVLQKSALKVIEDTFSKIGEAVN